jgi:GMP synthase-like glutamine amidotransferase
MTVIIVVLVPLTNLYLQTKQLAKSSLSETRAVYIVQSVLEELKAKEFKAIISTGSWVEVEDGRYRIIVANKSDYLKEVTVIYQYDEPVGSKELSLTMYKAKR